MLFEPGNDDGRIESARIRQCYLLCCYLVHFYFLSLSLPRARVRCGSRAHAPAQPSWRLKRNGLLQDHQQQRFLRVQPVFSLIKGYGLLRLHDRVRDFQAALGR